MRPDSIPPEANAPVWTIPVENVPNDNEDLPSYNHFVTSQTENHPPDYFDISIIPEGGVLHYSEIIPYQEPSKAKIQRKPGRVLSIDPLLDKNPDQLWLYFMTYLNEKPCLIVTIHGHHMESDTTPASYHRYTSPGFHRNDDRTGHVTDFNYAIDLTAYVSEHCWRLAVIPTKKKSSEDETITFRDALEQYTHSEKSFKQMSCQKQLFGWDFEVLKYKIRDLILSTGYPGTICIDFSLNNHQIIARSSSELNRFSRSMRTRILCFLSCLWLIFAPIYFYLRAVGRIRYQIAADYPMLSTSEIFLQRNANCIVKAAKLRLKARFAAKVP